MARFYSNHEINKMDKRLDEDELLNTQKYKNDLKKALNDEYHRINIDSAKKRAVNQRMDYDGFHQMVLGADLKGLKKDDISNIVSQKNCIMNSSLVNKKLGEEVDVISKNFIQGVDLIDKDKQITIESTDNKVDYKTFVKQWKAFKTNSEKVDYLRSHSSEFESILNSTTLIDADFFTDVLYQCGICEKKDSIILGCVKILLQNKQIMNLKKFISKKTKALYDMLDNSLGENEIVLLEEIRKIINTQNPI
jgi:hypothetical protein